VGLPPTPEEVEEFVEDAAPDAYERLVDRLLASPRYGERWGRHWLDVARYGETGRDEQRRMLNRDVKYLNEAGWDIQNVGDPGENARYVLRARDIRLRVELSRPEQAELSRVGRIAGVDEFADYVGTEPGPPEHPSGPNTPLEQRPPDAQLAMCLDAAATRRIVQFIYKGKPRTVHPRVVQPGPSGWYLIGCEQGQSIEKYFVVDRMRNLVFDQPGTATAAEDVRRSTLDPATWEVDPPVEVKVETTRLLADQVKLALGTPIAETTDGDRVVLTLRVTNRAAFRMRLYPLGTRVRVLGPDEIRAEILDELTQLAGST
jgi:predicted DNA-binding transcriptional regulator YafY